MISKEKKGVDPRYDNTGWIITLQGHLYVLKEKEGGSVLSDVGLVNTKMSYSRKGHVEGIDNVAIIRVQIGREIFALSINKLMNHKSCFPELLGSLAAGNEPKKISGKFFLFVWTSHMRLILMSFFETT
jgi:hypothetical protein